RGGPARRRNRRRTSVRTGRAPEPAADGPEGERPPGPRPGGDPRWPPARDPRNCPPPRAEAPGSSAPELHRRREGRAEPARPSKPGRRLSEPCSDVPACSLLREVPSRDDRTTRTVGAIRSIRESGSRARARRGGAREIRRSGSLGAVEEIDVRPVDDARLLHDLRELRRLGEPAGTFEVVRLEEDDDLLRIVRAAEHELVVEAGLLPDGAVGVEEGLPAGEILDFVTNEDEGHARLLALGGSGESVG